MLLFTVFISTVTVAGERLPDVRLPTLAVPSHCSRLNHCKEHENDRDHLIQLCFNHYCNTNDETVHCIQQNEEGKTKAIYYCSVSRFCDAGMKVEIISKYSNE